MNFLFFFPYIAWLVLSALLFAFGEYLSKKFALAPSFSYVALIVFIYALGTLAWLPAILQKNQLSIVGAIWSVMSLVATVGIGVLIFGEQLNTVAIVGLILGLLSILLLSLA